jgi:hypothetical protein
MLLVAQHSVFVMACSSFGEGSGRSLVTGGSQTSSQSRLRFGNLLSARISFPYALISLDIVFTNDHLLSLSCPYLGEHEPSPSIARVPTLTMILAMLLHEDGTQYHT